MSKQLHIPREYLNAYSTRLSKGDPAVLKLDNIRKQGTMEQEQFTQMAIQVLSAKEKPQGENVENIQESESASGGGKKSNLFPELAVDSDLKRFLTPEAKDIINNIKDDKKEKPITIPDSIVNIPNNIKKYMVMTFANRKPRNAFYEREKILLSDLPIYDISNMTVEELSMHARARVNPFLFHGPRYQRNCQRCQGVFELRCRGYDVIAAPRGSDELDPLPYNQQWSLLYKNGELKTLSNTDIDPLGQIMREVQEAGNGARFSISIPWNSNKGHVFNIVNINGEAVFMDSQVNMTMDKGYYEQKRYHRPGDEIFGWAADIYGNRLVEGMNVIRKKWQIYYMRTDNVEINEDYLRYFIS